jgi:hypothetical protein
LIRSLDYFRLFDRARYCVAGIAFTRRTFAPDFVELNKYDATTHFVGQSKIFSLTTERATGEAYCLAHHVAVA